MRSSTNEGWRSIGGTGIIRLLSRTKGAELFFETESKYSLRDQSIMLSALRASVTLTLSAWESMKLNFLGI